MPSGGTQSEVMYSAGPTADRVRRTATLVDDGILLPVDVEGLKATRYILADEEPILDATADPASLTPGVSFLGPLDPLIWDRKGLLRGVFEFDYLWEVYVPEPKRRWGYYVLPVLFGDRFVGRIEPRLDRKSKVLAIIGLWVPARLPADGSAGVPCRVCRGDRGVSLVRRRRSRHLAAHPGRPRPRRARYAVSPPPEPGTAAKARTGNVPIPRTGAGTALNVKPVGGQAGEAGQVLGDRDAGAEERGVDGSPPVLVSSMLTESIPTTAAPRAASGRRRRRRGTGDPVDVRVGSPMGIPAGVDQDRPPRRSRPANASGPIARDVGSVACSTRPSRSTSPASSRSDTSAPSAQRCDGASR